MKRSLVSFVATGFVFLGLIGVAFAKNPHGPELDPGSLGSGLALLGGSGLILIERFRRRNRK